MYKDASLALYPWIQLAMVYGSSVTTMRVYHDHSVHSGRAEGGILNMYATGGAFDLLASHSTSADVINSSIYFSKSSC